MQSKFQVVIHLVFLDHAFELMLNSSMEMEPTQRNVLIKTAAEAALELDRQLNVLLDCYDFYVQRYEIYTDSTRLTLVDLQSSIKELGHLPHQVAIHLQEWRNDEETTLSREGFEIHVLNEFALHMHAVATFMVRNNIDTEPLSPPLIGSSFNTLREVNRKLSARVT